MDLWPGYRRYPAWGVGRATGKASEEWRPQRPSRVLGVEGSRSKAILPIVENQMEKQMENEMVSGSQWSVLGFRSLRLGGLGYRGFKA